MPIGVGIFFVLSVHQSVDHYLVYYFIEIFLYSLYLLTLQYAKIASGDAGYFWVAVALCYSN